MKKTCFVLAVVVVAGVTVFLAVARGAVEAATDPHAGHTMDAQAPAQPQYPPFTRPGNDRIPPGNDQAAEALKASKQSAFDAGDSGVRFR